MLEKSSTSYLGAGCREFESRHSDHKIKGGLRPPFILCPIRDSKDPIATCRWHVAATSSKTGGFLYFRQRRKCKRVSPLRPPPPVLPYLKRIPDYLPAGQQPQYNRRIFQEKFVVPSLVRLPSPKIGMTSPRYVGSGLKIQAAQSFVRARISRKSRMN